MNKTNNKRLSIINTLKMIYLSHYLHFFCISLIFCLPFISVIVDFFKERQQTPTLNSIFFLLLCLGSVQAFRLILRDIKLLNFGSVATTKSIVYHYNNPFAISCPFTCTLETPTGEIIQLNGITRNFKDMDTTISKVVFYNNKLIPTCLLLDSFGYNVELLDNQIIPKLSPLCYIKRFFQVLKNSIFGILFIP